MAANLNQGTSTNQLEHCPLIISLAPTNAHAPETSSRTVTTAAVLQIIMALAKATESANSTKTAPLTFEVWREAESREGSCRLLRGDAEESESSDKKNANPHVSEHSSYP